MDFADIHSHILYYTDDGAETDNQMYDMFDAAYADGTRMICATPHFDPVNYRNNMERAQKVFAKLSKYAGDFPDMKLSFGNELRYRPGCLEWLRRGECRTLNGSRYVLIEYSELELYSTVLESVKELSDAGYVPVLAHAERYMCFHDDFREIIELRLMGTVIQVDAPSPFGGIDITAMRRSRRLFLTRLADVVASNMHNSYLRKPQLSPCFRYVEELCGTPYAQEIFVTNPENILHDREICRDIH